MVIGLYLSRFLCNILSWLKFQFALLLVKYISIKSRRKKLIRRKLSLMAIALLSHALLVFTVGLILAQAPAGQAYVVQPGDRLTIIAAQFLGDPGAYSQIIEATNA